MAGCFDSFERVGGREWGNSTQIAKLKHFLYFNDKFYFHKLQTYPSMLFRFMSSQRVVIVEYFFTSVTTEDDA